MFGHRSDGKKVKNIPGVFRIIPCVMKERSDSQVFFKQDIPLKSLDAYMEKKQEEGIKLSYMMIIYAAMIRIIAERPQLNRFVMNGSTYQRNQILVSLTMKKSLTDEGEESTIKIPFTGNETIWDIKEIIEKTVEESKKVEAETETDSLVKILNILPDRLLRKLVNFLMFLDKHGIMPKAVIDASPFHTSAYLTNVGSIGIDSIYHHLYNFGTTSMFLAMGKKKKSYIYEDDEIIQEKCINLAFVGDERICDGYYYANSFKLLMKYLKHPELLEIPLSEKKEQEALKKQIKEAEAESEATSK